MIINIKDLKYKCQFCSGALESRFSKCFNVYCQGHKFNLDNFVINRLNPELRIGRIIKKLEIPASRSLDDEDSYFITKHKVKFENNVVKIIHPLDLIHYVYEVNERILTKYGIGTINSNNFLMKDGSISYEVILPNGKLTQIYESEIISKYETPIKRIIARKKIDPPKNFLIKYWANLFHSYYTSYQIKCITNSRLSLMPHQINVAHRLSEEYFPRIILADEVGLGKTIEAGIYIKEMMARNLAERILIIVPATLVKQWQFEMQNKFNIEFTLYDGKKIKELKKSGTQRSAEVLQNPFYYDNLIICSLQFARNRKYINLLSQISWDIVIFDESHHLRRYLINATTGNYRETLNYDLARNLSLTTESLLLLSATPLQLHSFELYSLIELIQREAFDSFSDFEHFRKNMPFINLLTANINQIDKLNNFEVKNTIALLKNLNHVNKSKTVNEILDQLKNKDYKFNLLKKIEKDHTLSQFLIRNRKKNVFSEDFINERVVKTILVNPTKQELELYNEIRLYLAKIYNTSTSKENIGIGFIITTLQKLLTSSKYAFLKSLERRLKQIERQKNISIEMSILREEDPEYYELELEDEYIDSEVTFNGENESPKGEEKAALDYLNQENILRAFYTKLNALPYDSKCQKLVELVELIYRQNRTEKILVFTQFVDTLLYLKELLNSQKEDYFVETFYGGLDKLEKDEAVERFRTSNKFAILISTEIGGEGRNFQFARNLINYDLPWNPMKLEQRIGRLDRIGQKSKKIYIYNFYLEGTIETDIMFALDKRIHLFEESIGQLEPIIGKIEKDIKNIIFTEEEGKRRKKFNEFNRKVDLEVRKAKEIEMQLDDLLIDKKSFQIDDLITSVEACQEVKLTHNELFLLVKYFFDLYRGKYGIVDFLKDNNIEASEMLRDQTKITINNILLKNPKYGLVKEYVGTFDLNIAREREEIDFFALGHPLINDLIDFCMSSALEGTFTVLTLKRSVLPDHVISHFSAGKELYLFIFNVKYQGYILENQYSAVAVDNRGNEILDLADFVLDINKFQDLILAGDGSPYESHLDLNFLDQLTQKAKNLVKKKISQWKNEIKALNAKIFKIEINKKEKIFAYNKRLLTFKLESLKQKLEKKEGKKPTERQLLNIKSNEDTQKRQERLDKIDKLKEEIRFLEKDIVKVEKKLDDLAFEFDDLKKDMSKRNRAKYYTNLNACAILRVKE
ncbi:MAG: DEAD/DEAH box helicase family protein [Candidatus Lokiarchaeota archaeon]|nr:DEAD/DEAH box helicase family protein [Candidatus Lokiarchaeota archaeon]